MLNGHGRHACLHPEFAALCGHHYLEPIACARHDPESKGIVEVVVHSDHQCKGIGQALIRHGLKALRDEGVSVILTYGDPSFYGNVGFQAISDETVRAPFECH